VLWRGDSDLPPQPTPNEAAYFAAIQPFRDRLGELQARLQGVASLAAQGQLDAVSTDDLGALASDLWAARQAFARAHPPVRLDRYDQLVETSLALANEAAGLFLRARASDRSAERDLYVPRAVVLAANSAKVNQQARDELSTILAIVVEPAGPER
jgi:hypothetical protein